MPTTLETFQLNMLQPAQRPEDARQDAIKLGVSLTLTKGQALSIKTADGLGYALAPGSSDGTQTAIGLCMYDLKTDANGKIFFSDSATATWRTSPWTVAPYWVKGIFDPADITTKATPVKQVDTYTAAGTVTVGDIYTIQYTAADGTVTSIAYTAGASPTATTVAAGIIALWNANSTLAAVAVASGTTTVVLTATVAGNTFTTVNPAGTASTGAAVGTWTRVATTAATGRTMSDLAGGIPGVRQLANGFWELP